MIRLVEFVNTVVSSGGGSGKEESMFEIVMHHLTDHVMHGGLFDTINSVLSKLSFNLGPLHFDMRMTKWVMMMWIVMVLCIIVFVPLARKIKRDSMGSKSRWVNAWEFIIGFVHDEVVEPNFDPHYVKKAMPYFLNLFFFILFCNLAGLFPGQQQQQVISLLHLVFLY